MKNNTETLILAPMAGITDIAFRSQCVRFGADKTYTEMISVNGLSHNGEKTLKMLVRHETERNIAVQLFGDDPILFKEAVQNPVLEGFSSFDINMGCPVPKVTKRGAGCQLMSNASVAERIIRACVDNTTRPITVKIRLGRDEANKNAVEFARMIEGAGAKAVAVHGRTWAQGYSGKADYVEIAKVRNALKIPVIANGDIVDMESLRECREITGCESFMIGRGAYGRVWVFDELRGGNRSINPFKIILEHIAELEKYYPDSFITPYMRHHISRYVRSMQDARAIRNKTNTINELSLLKNTINELSLHF